MSVNNVPKDENRIKTRLLGALTYMRVAYFDISGETHYG